MFLIVLIPTYIIHKQRIRTNPFLKLAAKSGILISRIIKTPIINQGYTTESILSTSLLSNGMNMIMIKIYPKPENKNAFAAGVKDRNFIRRNKRNIAKSNVAILAIPGINEGRAQQEMTSRYLIRFEPIPEKNATPLRIVVAPSK